jgi:glycosyltransferase involved in cell wall biosynthesis
LATSVIIPARNEESTIGSVITAFRRHPGTRPSIFVGIDADTTDDTAEITRINGATAIHTDRRGKGQVVNDVLKLLTRHGVPVLSDRIILCDADYTGLTPLHIDKILWRQKGMTIGVPDLPDIPVPQHVTDAWPRVSGFRCLPWAIIPEDAHGYLLETQINIMAATLRLETRMVEMPGLKAPFQWPLSEQRMHELQRDRQWGTFHGVL